MENLPALSRGGLGINKAIAAASAAVLAGPTEGSAPLSCLPARREISPASPRSFINKYLLGVYYVPGVVLGGEDTMVMKSRIVTL